MKLPKTHAASLKAEALETRDTPATFTVTTTADGGVGSLRDAITRANATAAADTIAFAIPTTDPGFVDVNTDGLFNAGDRWSIALASALPAITRTVTLDGWSQRGAGYHGRPVIELNGAGAGAGSDGLAVVNHSGSVLRGLVINRFDGNGITLVGGGSHRIQGNYIGTDAAGAADSGNSGAGVFATDSALNTIGGTQPGRRNLISGNDLQGIHLGGAGCVGNQILGNLVGTTVSGDTALANGSAVYLGDGIRIEGGGFNVIGGSTAAARNVLSGNFDDGVDIRDGAIGNVVKGNYLGTDRTGRNSVANGADGVYIQDASGNLVGGLVTGEANTIGGNGYNGVFLYGDAHDNTIVGNFIGTNARGDDVGNGTVATFADGVFFAQFGAPVGPSDNTVLRNVIAFNADSAVSVDVDTTATPTGNSILRNSIYGNKGMGGGVAIDLASDGVTPNDAGDPDGGPNDLQNFPVLTTVTTNPDGTRTVRGTLNSTPNTTYRIEFFASSSAGEGRTFLGFKTVTTDGAGVSPAFGLRFARVPGQRFITATATDLATGDTSEFSLAVG